MFWMESLPEPELSVRAARVRCQDSATDHQKHANASEALPTSYAAAEASRSPPPVASRTAMAKRASIDSDSGSDSDAEPVTAMRPAPGGGSGAREWEGGWRESSGGRYGHGSSDLGAASLQEKRKQQQSQAASAEPGATMAGTQIGWGGCE